MHSYKLNKLTSNIYNYTCTIMIISVVIRACIIKNKNIHEHKYCDFGL